MKLQLEKISEIINFKSPKNANELKSFLGVIGFLRKFINERAILTAPLYGLLKKNKRFMWDDLCEINFRNLKQKVAEVDTLLLSNFLKPFIVFCDASDKTKAFNLAQEENKQLRRVFFNGGRPLSDSDRRYYPNDKELLSVCYANKRCYIY